MDSDTLHYIQTLVGTPWERSGLHCWKLVVMIQGDVFGRRLPDGPTVAPKLAERREIVSVDPTPFGWAEVPVPIHGAIVRMYRIGGNPADVEHTGVYLDLDGGRVIHTNHPHGVVVDTLHELAARGWAPRWFIPD